jgi:hypothetical protein
MEEQSRRGLIDAVVDVLRFFVSSRTMEILIARASGQTLADIGKRYVISRERARQIEQAGLGNIPEAGKAALLRLSEATPLPAGIQRSMRVADRKAVRSYAAENPHKCYNYQQLHAKLGITPPTQGEFLHMDSLMQLYRDYGINRIGYLYHCTLCDSFKHKDDFAPGVLKRSLHCRVCNTKRCGALYKATKRGRYNKLGRPKADLDGGAEISGERFVPLNTI